MLYLLCNSAFLFILLMCFTLLAFFVNKQYAKVTKKEHDDKMTELKKENEELKKLSKNKKRGRTNDKQ